MVDSRDSRLALRLAVIVWLLCWGLLLYPFDWSAFMALLDVKGQPWRGLAAVVLSLFAPDWEDLQKAIGWRVRGERRDG